MSMKDRERVAFSVVFNVGKDQWGYEATLAHLEAWLTEKGLKHRIPTRFCDPIQVDIDLTR